MVIPLSMEEHQWIEDIRFLMMSVWDDFVDEVMITNGIVHIYRHDIGSDVDEDQLEFIMCFC
jgi:hypothetical protein